MKKILLLGVVLFGMIQIMSSQHMPMDEVIYLKNGSVIRGIIVEQVPNQSLKIQTADGSLFVFDMDEVEKITKEVRVRRGRGYYQEQSVVEESSDKIGRPMGMIQFAGLGYQDSYDDWYGDGMAYFSYNFVYGYQFWNRLFIGGGLGMEHMVGDVLPDSYNLRIPVFAAIKINLNKKRVSPFFQFDGGFHFNTEETIDNGFFFQPKFGLDFNLGHSRRKALFLSMSLCEFGKNTYYYRYYNHYDYGGYYYDGYYSDSEFYPKVGLNFGFRF